MCLDLLVPGPLGCLVGQHSREREPVAWPMCCVVARVETFALGLEAVVVPVPVWEDQCKNTLVVFLGQGSCGPWGIVYRAVGGIVELY